MDIERLVQSQERARRMPRAVLHYRAKHSDFRNAGEFQALDGSSSAVTYLPTLMLAAQDGSWKKHMSRVRMMVLNAPQALGEPDVQGRVTMALFECANEPRGRLMHFQFEDGRWYSYDAVGLPCLVDKQGELFYELQD